MNMKSKLLFLLLVFPSEKLPTSFLALRLLPALPRKPPYLQTNEACS
jgi:hypothetical protein